MANPKFFRFPFAATGDKETIPDEVQTSGALSYAEGFGLDYERDPTKDTKAKRMPRDGTNQVLYDATSNIQQYQLNGAPFWYDASNNGGTAIQYQKNAMVRYADNGVENVYISLKDNNTDTPNVETSWFLFAPYDATLLSDLSVAPFVPVTSMTFTTPPATPTRGQLYLVPNNATGAWANKNGMIAEWDGKKWLFAATNEGHSIGLSDGRLFTKVNGAYVEKIAQDSQSGKWNYAEVSGAANALTATLNPAPISLTAGLVLRLKIKLANTSSATLNVNGLGAKTILSADGNTLKANELVVGQIAVLVFDGTNFICLNSGAIKNWVNDQIISRSPKIMRQGSVVVAASGKTFSTIRVTFDTAFPSSCTGVVITPNGIVNAEGFVGTPYARGITRSYFDLVLDTNGTKLITTPVPCSYIAIGY